MGVSRADNSVKNWRNLPISNPKPDLHNINAHTKFGENPLMFTQVIIRKRKTDGRTTDGGMDGQTDGLTDDQRETIIPRHYCVAGYKNWGEPQTHIAQEKASKVRYLVLTAVVRQVLSTLKKSEQQKHLYLLHH